MEQPGRQSWLSQSSLDSLLTSALTGSVGSIQSLDRFQGDAPRSVVLVRQAQNQVDKLVRRFVAAVGSITLSDGKNLMFSLMRAMSKSKKAGLPRESMDQARMPVPTIQS